MKADMILKAILSEKTYKQMEKGIYTFLVYKRATKDKIAQAVAAQFAVDIAKVNVSSVAPKVKRIAKTRKQVKTAGGKKAVVWLKAGQSIAPLSPKTSQKSKSTPKEKDVQKMSVEGKEG